MTRSIIATSLLILLGMHASEEASTGRGKWRKLFDGKTLNGWHVYGKNYPGTCWQVENKAIHLVPAANSPDKGDLVTDDSFENFDLKLEWKIAQGGNSGVIFLVHEDTVQFKATFVTGLEMQVLDNIGAEDNKKENHLAGALYDLAGNAADSRPKAIGQWNKSEIVCDHGSLKLYLNGTRVVSLTLWDDNWKAMVANSKFRNMPAFGTFRTGRIALQYHGGQVWYRNIRIISLPSNSPAP